MVQLGDSDDFAKDRVSDPVMRKTYENADRFSAIPVLYT